MATPQVPPRPVRSQHPAAATTADSTSAAPRLPPRPAGRRKDRSVSPDRYAMSPLNDLPRMPSSGGLYANAHANRSASSIDSPARPPSVNLPSLGQEGNEYGDLERHEQQNALERTRSEGAAAHTSHIDSELPLHAPKPSLSKSGARAQVAAVTRTDSNQAVAAGIGSTFSPRDDHDPYNRPLQSKTSSGYIRPPSSIASDRPGSASLEEQGIPHIGRHVPMLPNAGDVQAPSPAPGSQHGDMFDGRPRHHGRRHSGREIFHGPPGSYGLHGHGIANADKLEKNWYAKHPDELAKEEHGHYSPALSENRPEWALSSDILNKIVQSTAKGAGYGTSADIDSLPNEQIGYLASDEFTNRLNSPRLPSNKHNHKRSVSQSHVESPLRQENFPQEALDHAVAKHRKLDSEEAVEGDGEDVIHIDPPEDPVNKVTGEGVENCQSFAHRHASSEVESGYAEDHGYSAPILAPDEVTPGSEWLQPAISPGLVPDRRGSAQFDDFGHLHRHISHLGSASSSRQGSRAGSRPGSIHGIPALSKMTSHDEHEERYTPLEDVEEYEPLFPEDDGKSKKPMTQADRLKRRPDMKQRFPSQDIWEDTPNSLQLLAEVTSPELPGEHAEGRGAAALPAFERPNKEAARKNAAGAGDENQLTLTPTQELLARAGLQLGANDMTAVQRFPSHDIWEDSPDHAALTTTVQGPQEEEEVEVTQEVISKHPSIPPRPSRTKSGDALDNAAHPKVPPRPPKKQTSTDSAESETRKPPTIPDRPKPHVPLRPSKSSSRDSNENAPLTKTVSKGSTGSVEEESVRQAKPAPPIKPKPMVPVRPAGGKIAALQAGFMADLNSRLKIGPREQPAPKVEEPLEEKGPLQDARKGRARGPARRKPAAHSASQQLVEEAQDAPLSLCTAWTVWHSHPERGVEVPEGTSGPSDKISGEPEVGESAKSAPLPKVTEEGPVVEEPKALSKQNSMDVSEDVHSGDKDPELPVPPATEATSAENTEASAPVASEVTAPADPGAPSSIANDDLHAGLGPARAGNVKTVPDADKVAEDANKAAGEEVDVEIPAQITGGKPEMRRKTTDEVLIYAESAQDEHVEAEN